MNKTNRNEFARDAYLGIVVLADALVFFASLMVAFWCRFRLPLDTILYTAPLTLREFSGHFIFGTLVFHGIAVWLGIYKKPNLLRFQRPFLHYLQICALWAGLYLLLTLLIRFEPEVSRLYVIFAFLISFPALCVERRLLETLFGREFIARKLRQRIIIVGWTEESGKLAESISGSANHPYEIMGCVPLPKIGFRQKPPSGIQALGIYESIPDILKAMAPDIVVLADVDLATADVAALAENCYRELVQFKVVPSFFQILISNLKLETIGAMPVLGVEDPPILYLHNRLMKRAVDIAGAFAGLVLGLPVVAVFALLIQLESPGPAFYGQKRIGRMGRIFQIWKLRSMRPDAEKAGAGWTVKQDPRVLRIGMFMRRWNIDEIPQFWNVLMGQMSLVGPRPERPEFIEKFKEEIRYYNLRHGIMPGMTGWAQIHGWRGDTDIDQRIRFDLHYAENWSPWLDLYIIFFTIFSYRNAH